MNGKSDSTWSKPADLKKQVQRLWDSGKLLRSTMRARSDGAASSDADTSDADAESSTYEPLIFPYRLRLKKPTSKELSGSFDQVRQWISALDNIKHVRIEWRDVRHPQLGTNTIPKDVWLDSLDDALALIGKRQDARLFDGLVEKLHGRNSQLIAWVEKQPLKVLKLQNEWERLLQLHSHMCMHPDAGIFLRQISVPGIDTKFIEAHRKVLSDWLDLTLPEQYVNDSHRGTAVFASRYGYRVKPTRYRLRSLDVQKPLINTAPDSSALACADMTLDVSTIAELNPQHAYVLIVENEITYLSLPEISDTIALFGGGYGFKNIDSVQWLHHCEVYYWGDIDIDGFAILDQLRAQLPTVFSLLMDRQTLLLHKSMIGTDSHSTRRELRRLTEDELALYHELLDSRLGERVRLEQEQINFNYACDVLRRSLCRD